MAVCSFCVMFRVVLLRWCVCIRYVENLPAAAMPIRGPFESFSGQFAQAHFPFGPILKVFGSCQSLHPFWVGGGLGFGVLPLLATQCGPDNFFRDMANSTPDSGPAQAKPGPGRAWRGPGLAWPDPFGLATFRAKAASSL